MLGNHDRRRVATPLGAAQARAAAVLLLTLRGTPTLYYGDELGLVDVDVPPERVQDPWELRVPGHGRDGARTPMQWDDGPNAGFCTAAASRGCRSPTTPPNATSPSSARTPTRSSRCTAIC